jgi:uncharacterized repeat protein (TIGR03803 family)
MLLQEKIMATRIPDVLRTNWNGALRPAAIYSLLVVFTVAVPLRAQSYQDLYNFNCPTGCTPSGALTQGKDGNLYGTTSSGGSNNLGTIFSVNTTGTAYNVLWNFDSTTNGSPSGGLTLSSVDGNFYGTTGGSGIGTLYRFNSSTMTLTPLHQFSTTEGVPQGPPVEDKLKNLYGLNEIGADPGMAYEYTVATGTYQLLPKTIPPAPSGPLMLASDGNLYGATVFGGKPDAGTVFRLVETGGVKVLYPFSGGSDGGAPNAPLAQGKDGNLYGTTYSGGGGVGTVFEVTLPASSSTETVLYEFDGSDNGATHPEAGLLAASDGNFYGTSYYGGIDNLGTVFEMSGGTYIPFVDLSGNAGTTSGAYPTTTLMEDTNGLFYGLTSAGGTNGSGSGDGVFFSVTPPNLLSHISLCCNWWVILDQPVTILGQNLTGVISVSFGPVPAQFKLGSGTYLIAKVPSAAIDSLVTVTLATGLQVTSQQEARILPKITSLDPSSGSVGTPVSIVGGGFAGATKVTFGGVATGNFNVVSPALIQATVPSGAQTGKVGVVTPNGSALSKQTFTVN